MRGSGVVKEVTVAKRRITIRLAADLEKAIRREASISPNGELTPVIVRYIEEGVARERQASPSAHLLPATVLIGVILDLFREARIPETSPAVTARQLYGLLLEKMIHVQGVSE